MESKATPHLAALTFFSAATLSSSAAIAASATSSSTVDAEGVYIETMVVTAAMPMTIPNTVSPARILFSSRLFSPSWTVWKMVVFTDEI